MRTERGNESQEVGKVQQSAKSLQLKPSVGVGRVGAKMHTNTGCF